MVIPSLETIKGILILGNDGKRIISKYYDNVYSTNQKLQKDFEKDLFSKTNKKNGDIIMLNDMTVLYKSSIDLNIYVIGSTNENEILLLSFINCLYDALILLLRKNLEKRYLFENLDTVIMLIDELCDNGIILEMDPTNLIQRVCVRQDDGLPFNEQTVVDVLKSFLK